MGAPPVAESSDLSEWQRSIADEGFSKPRKISGTATGDDLTTPKALFTLMEPEIVIERKKEPSGEGSF